MKARPVSVNGKIFPSARAAARYIATEETKWGNVRKENTIAKELKRTFPENGGACWYMYDRWMVNNVIPEQ